MIALKNSLFICATNNSNVEVLRLFRSMLYTIFKANYFSKSVDFIKFYKFCYYYIKKDILYIKVKKFNKNELDYLRIFLVKIDKILVNDMFNKLDFLMEFKERSYFFPDEILEVYETITKI